MTGTQARDATLSSDIDSTTCSKVLLTLVLLLLPSWFSEPLILFRSFSTFPSHFLTMPRRNFFSIFVQIRFTQCCDRSDPIRR